MHTYNIGDLVTYRTFGDKLRTVRVTARHEDIKNGRAGFDGLTDYGTPYQETVWGYDAQIVSVAAPEVRCDWCGHVTETPQYVAGSKFCSNCYPAKRETPCLQCGRAMNPAERILGAVCGRCVRENHRRVTRTR